MDHPRKVLLLQRVLTLAGYCDYNDPERLQVALVPERSTGSCPNACHLPDCVRRENAGLQPRRPAPPSKRALRLVRNREWLFVARLSTCR